MKNEILPQFTLKKDSSVVEGNLRSSLNLWVTVYITKHKLGNLELI